ncbi:DUF4112 domain-containing protein [Altererythrobacter aurantiacus]|uniref:DUF4112 domain-containing protein n=1 Tax=Parapontixanthobacter aurantiacus TaxID=1463599 RepID=A0A844ZGW0_9SPHN|nr:DUF4112 domain-containing protein [Parapontixanthobacter aurantiacus]
MDRSNGEIERRHVSGSTQGKARPMGFELPTGNDPVSIRKRIETLEMLLERSFRIPGINYPVGLDSIVGLVPVVGDFITAGLGAYIVWEARNLGLPKWKLWRMGGHIAVDTAIGAVPLIGDAFDLVYKSNTKNLRIIRKHLDKHHPESRILEG